jgi:hypothetical protein
MTQIVKKSLLFLLLFAPACTNSQKQSNYLPLVDIEANVKNMQQVSLSRFTTDCRYILLEKIEGLELQGIFKADFSDSLIIVSDYRNCLLYDRNGNFISKIGTKGRGPEEYNSTTNISLSLDREVYLQSLYDLYKYKIDGSFSDKYKSLFSFKTDFISAWLQLNDSLFLGKVNRMTGQEKYKALIFNIRGGVKYYFNNYIFLNRKKPLAGPEESVANIYSFQRGIYFKEWCNDTLFLMTEKFQLKPVCNFYFGKYSQQFLQGEDDLPGWVSTLNNYIWMENIFQFPGFLLLDCNFNKYFPAKRLTSRTVMENVTLDHNTTHALGVYDLKTNKLVFCKPTDTDNPLFSSGFYNDIDAGPRFYPSKQVDDSTMVMWIEAKQLKDHVASDDFQKSIPKYPEKKKQLEELANRLTNLDNPVLMFVNFRK